MLTLEEFDEMKTLVEEYGWHEVRCMLASCIEHEESGKPGMIAFHKIGPAILDNRRIQMEDVDVPHN